MILLDRRDSNINIYESNTALLISRKLIVLNKLAYIHLYV